MTRLLPWLLALTFFILPGLLANLERLGTGR